MKKKIIQKTVILFLMVFISVLELSAQDNILIIGEMSVVAGNTYSYTARTDMNLDVTQWYWNVFEGGTLVSTSIDSDGLPRAIVTWNASSFTEGIIGLEGDEPNNSGYDQFTVRPNNNPNPINTNQNYIKTTIFKTDGVDIPSASSSSTGNPDAIENITYFDGIGRPIQQVAVKGADGYDIITPISYDVYGRQTKQYLSYSVFNNNNGAIRTNPIQEVHDFYITDKYENTVLPYSETILENSPLSRPLRQASPGNDWAAMTDEHTIKFEYSSNTLNDNVKYFTVSHPNNNKEETTLVFDDYYEQAMIYKFITKDENWKYNQQYPKDHTTEEFKNKQGQVVLKRTYNDNEVHDTYYVYDDYGNLTYVLPPKMNSGDPSQDIITIRGQLDDLGYQYNYDYRNRLIIKQIPGKKPEYIVYDNLDRPVFTQDKNLRNVDTWLFTKYDAFNRVAYTGKYISTKTRNQLQTIVKNSDTINEMKLQSPLNGVYYTNNVITTDLANMEILTVNYYDNYDFDIGLGVSNYAFNVLPTNKVNGLATGGKVKVLDDTGINWITTVIYYDEKSRPLYIYSYNDYLLTEDKTENKYNFTGQLLRTRTQHTKDGNPITTDDYFTYDHMQRLEKQSQIINGVTANKEVIVKHTYDELGQLNRKAVGGKQSAANNLQDIDYTYNIRGWLKEINNSDWLGDDLFAFKINYNSITETPTGDASLNTAPLYNGNISETIWRTASDNVKRGYGYEYDALNRIKKGTYKAGNSFSSEQNFFNLREITYDKNGNILKLRRNAATTDYTAYTELDRLTYKYKNNGNSNQLSKVTDIVGTINTHGFKDVNVQGEADYTYDKNGNLKKDLNKGITSIKYNHLNLPTKVVFNTGGPLGNNEINYVYDATGVKLSKSVVNREAFYAAYTNTFYAAGFIYKQLPGQSCQNCPVPSIDLQFLSTSEGYVEPDNAAGFNYVYQYKDHLGNIRLSYSDADGNGSIDASTEIISEKNYYPFGLSHRGYNNVVSANANSQAEKYQYNGKELNEELGLDWYDYGARNYDPAIGRWMNIDNMADLAPSLTPFRYAFNNPIKFLDPDGNYERDGHFWSVYLAATITQSSHKYDAYGLAYFAEAPDHVMNRAGDVRYATNTWLPGHGRQNSYHALGGTNRVEEAARSGQMYRNSKTMKARGAALHRLGDSYAHSKADGSMYGRPSGHFPNNMDADLIAERPELYLSYIKDLVGVLGGGSDTDLFAFEYIANSGGSTEQNSGILEAEVRIREGNGLFSVKGNQTSSLQSFFKARNTQYGTNKTFKTLSAEVETMEQNKNGEWELTGKKETRTFVIQQ